MALSVSGFLLFPILRPTHLHEMITGQYLLVAPRIFGRTVIRHYCPGLQKQAVSLVQDAAFPRATILVSHKQYQQQRFFSADRALCKQPPTMPQSPAKKQKLSANANERTEQEPHETTSKSAADQAEVDRDPYPNGVDHESSGKHDTTTTHKDEENEKQKEGGEWRSQPPYRTSEENHHFEKKHEAECSCGRIKYWLSEDKPLASKYCHCKDCQSLHGE